MDQTRTKNYLYAAGAVVVIAAVAIGLYAYGEFNVPKRSYQSEKYGIGFSYPENYQLTEHDSTGRHTIVLTDKDAAAATSTASEGPTAMIFDIFDNTKHEGVEAWVRRNPASNYQLSPNGNLATAAQNGSEAVAYVWDGLYRGESYVFEHKDQIVMASVTMMSQDDQIKKDFERVLRSLVLK